SSSGSSAPADPGFPGWFSPAISKDDFEEADCGSFPALAQAGRQVHGDAYREERGRVRSADHDGGPARPVFKSYGGAVLLRYEYHSRSGVFQPPWHDIRS